MDARQRGGLSNKRGNRYEDTFAVFKLLECAYHRQMNGETGARLKEQVPCPVDDLLVRRPSIDGYHQLKADAAITWGEAGCKLRLEFESQRALCEADGTPFELVIVVADTHRQKSLERNMPSTLEDVTTVFLFPRLERPVDLANHTILARRFLTELVATRHDSPTERAQLVTAFHSAWVNHLPDPEGYCQVDDVVGAVHELRYARLRRSWDPPEKWALAEKILDQIEHLKFWTDRGYFEWDLAGIYRGMFFEPCASESFERFLERVRQQKPTTFDQFEELMP